MPAVFSWLCPSLGYTAATGTTIASTNAGLASTIYFQPTSQTTSSVASNAYYALLGSGTAAATTAPHVWINGNTIVWEDQMDHSQYVALAQARAVSYRERTEAERREMEEREAERERRRRQMMEAERQARAVQEAVARQTEAERQAALRRSRELLLAHLTPVQRATFEKNAWFIVTGGKTNKKYRIQTTGYTGNIEELLGKTVVCRLCGHLRACVPLHDHHVAQLVSLRYDEEAFVRLCNRSAA